MKFRSLIIIVLLLLGGCERPTESDNGDNTPPVVPAGLQVYYASDGEVGIEWLTNRTVSLSGYNIYRSTDDSNYLLIDFTTSFYYIDYSLSYDSVYYYKVSAVSRTGIETALSSSVSARPVNRYTPRIPAQFFINARNWLGKRSIFLNWTANEETDLAVYKIYRSSTESFEADSSRFFTFITIPEFEDTTAGELFTRYYYKIKAVDKGNLESGASAERSDVILDEPAPLFPADNGTVSGFWEFRFISSGAPARYRLIVQTSPFFGEIWQTEINSTAIHDTVNVDVPSGVLYYNTPYYWKVAAFTESTQPNSLSQLNKFIIIRN
jgi:hypothetical protein